LPSPPEEADLYSPSNHKYELIAIVDTETTGVGDFDEPVSVGIILAEVVSDTGQLIRVVESYYGTREPKVPIHPKAYEIHGLSLADLQGKSFDLVQIRQLIWSARIIIAHNAKFDRRMLTPFVAGIEHLAWACSIYSLNYEWAKKVGGLRNLDAICAALGVVRRSPHNALEDCRALLDVLQCHAGTTPKSALLLKRLLARPWAPPP
jgi:DNA polymerase-3 subunit epsilon